MREPIENEYFNWLCAKVLDTRGTMYRELLKLLYSTPFVWSIFGDKNRAEDGLELRLDFLREAQWEPDPLWLEQECSVLEVFIAFSNRAAFQTDIPAKDWFWEFMTNLELNEFRWMTRGQSRNVENTLNIFMSRNYDPNGQGGMFPMRWPNHDQREVEIWYQFNEYLDDRGLL